MARRPCLTPGCPNLTNGRPRCPTHERHQTTLWKNTSAHILTDWRNLHGNWCPGYNRPGHHTPHLAAHHTDNPNAPYTVLCHSCNAAAG